MRCQIAKVGVKRWVNMCGHNISGQTSPGLYSAEPSDPAFVGANCMYYPEGFEYEKKDDEETSEGSAWRTYVRYNTSLDESVGYFKVESGMPTPLSWQLHSDFQSEEYRLAIVMLDVTGSALTARREWHSTLTHKDDAVPDGRPVVHAARHRPRRRTRTRCRGRPQPADKFGESSLGMDYMAVHLPARLPAVRHPRPLRVPAPRLPPLQLYNLAEIAKADNLTAMFEKAVGDDSAGYCTTRAAWPRYRRLARRRDVAGGPFTATTWASRCGRRPLRPDDMRNGHNATEPCGAYGQLRVRRELRRA